MGSASTCVAVVDLESNSRVKAIVIVQHSTECFAFDIFKQRMSYESLMEESSGGTHASSWGQ